MNIKKIKINKAVSFCSSMFLVLLVIIAVPSIANYRDNSEQLNLETVESTVKKYIIQCYATEGSYPADLYYLEENYGLILDEAHYNYVYEVFASNVMPSVKVSVK